MLQLPGSSADGRGCVMLVLILLFDRSRDVQQPQGTAAHESVLWIPGQNWHLQSQSIGVARTKIVTSHATTWGATRVMRSPQKDMGPTCPVPKCGE
jgi:hypothetical protein